MHGCGRATGAGGGCGAGAFWSAGCRCDWLGLGRVPRAVDASVCRLVRSGRVGMYHSSSGLPLPPHLSHQCRLSYNSICAFRTLPTMTGGLHTIAKCNAKGEETVTARNYFEAKHNCTGKYTMGSLARRCSRGGRDGGQPSVGRRFRQQDRTSFSG